MTRRLGWAWALLLPLTYLPTLAVGEPPSPVALGVLAASTSLALWAVLAPGRLALLERLAAWLDPRAGRVLALVLLAFALVSMAGACRRYSAFGESAMLGLFAQSYWTQLHGHAFANSQEGVTGALVSHFGLHFSPTLLLLLPLFALYPHALTLMAGQVAAVTLAPVPLYFLMKRRVAPSAALLLSLTVLTMPVLAWSGFVDFRDSSFLPVLLLATLWALDARRWDLLTLFALLALGLREDTGIIFVGLGLYAWASGSGLVPGVVLAASGLAWFVAIPKVAMVPFLSPGLIMDSERFFAAMFGQWGDTPVGAILGMLARPADVVGTVLSGEGLRYLYALLQPVLLLPALLDWAALMAAPGVAINLLASYSFMRSATQPYALAPAAFLALAAARSATRLAARAPEGERRASALALALIVLAGTLPAVALTVPTPDRSDFPRAAAERVVAAMPPGAETYAPMLFYPYRFHTLAYDSRDNVERRMRRPEFRARYRVIVLWPASDPPGQPRDAALVDTLASDPRFVERAGFMPFRLFERR